MVAFYESMSEGYEHIPFNICILKIADNLFDKQKKVFYAEEKHLKIIEDEYTDCKFSFIPVKLIDKGRKVMSLINEIRNLMHIKKNRKLNHLILTNSPPHTMLFAKFLFRKCNITFILHGTIEELLHEKMFYQLGYYTKCAINFRRNDKKINYLVLGDSIKSNLLKIMPKIKNLHSIMHPIDFEQISEHKVPLRQDQILRIGTIGSGSIEKGIKQLLYIEKKLRDIVGTQLELCHVGNLYNFNFPKYSKIVFCGGKEKISLEDYKKGIEELDYILFLFPKNSYKLTASGALCDAIVNKKPLLAIKNDYFEFVFQKAGNLGFLCDDIDEIIETIKTKILNHSYPQPSDYDRNYNLARNIFDVKSVEKAIRSMQIW